MKFSLSQDFPVGLEVLWSVYGNADYLAAKYRALGSSNLQLLKAHTDEETIHVVLERTVAPDLKVVPEWARKMVKQDYVMRHENRCRRHSGKEAEVSLHITPLGSPVDIRGQGRLAEMAAAQTRLSLDFEVECRIPIVGKKVAELFARKIRDALADDHDFTLGYIHGHGDA